jgi:hypothetical protein
MLPDVCLFYIGVFCVVLLLPGCCQHLNCIALPNLLDALADAAAAAGFENRIDLLFSEPAAAVASAK